MRFLTGNDKDQHEKVVNLVELAGDDGVLEGYRFENCRVKGPVVLVVNGEFNLVGNTIEGDPEAFLWEISPDRSHVLGAILVKDSTFEGCTFINVGLAGYPEFIEQIRQGVESQHAVS